MHTTNVYLFTTFLSFFIFFALAMYSLRFRRTTGTGYFFMSLILMSLLSLANVLEMVTQGFEQKLWWRNIEQIPLFFWPIFAYGVVWTFVGKDKRIIKRMLFLLSIPIIIYLGLIFTDQYHHLMRHKVTLVPLGQFKVTQVDSTTLSLFFIAYMAIIGLFPLARLFLNLKNVSTINKRQHYIIILATLIPYTFSLIQVIINTRISTPVALVPSGILFFYGFFRHKLLRVQPIAKDIVIENMKEGIIVLDQNDIIVDVNPSSTSILRTLCHDNNQQLIGKTIHPILQHHQGLQILYQNKHQDETELRVDQFFYSVSYIPIQIKKDYTGSLLIFTDITDRKTYESYLYKKATTDSLTNTYNRQYLLEATEKSLVEIGNKSGGLSFVLLDIDNFKYINDTYGHQAGDQVLVKFSKILKEMVTFQGLVGRVGGEEFSILLPDLNVEQAYQMAESIRIKVATTNVKLDSNVPITFRVSIGVTTATHASVNFKELYHKADQALYQSKNNGRDQTTIL